MFEPLAWRFTFRTLLAASLVGCSTLANLEEVRANNTANGGGNRGWPTRRVGGGSRTGCLPASRPCSSLMALVPEGLLRTERPSPTLLFYLPSIDNPRQVQLEFVLRDENDNLVYEKIFTSNGEEGLLEFALEPSKNFRGLESDRTYHWYLSIVRDRNDRSRDDVVAGWIQRVPPQGTIPHRFESLSAIERVKWYETENLPIEALSELARLKRSQPEDPRVSRLWREAIAALQLPLSEAIGHNPKLQDASQITSLHE